MINKDMLNLDIQIKEFEKIANQYPTNKAYQRMLERLQQEKADLAAKIGRKK